MESWVTLFDFSSKTVCKLLTDQHISLYFVKIAEDGSGTVFRFS